MTKEQKAKRYTPESRFDILTFIDGFRKHYVTKTFKSPQECRDFAWTDKSFEERQSPIVKMFTEGWCYYFARILEDAYPGGTLCLLKGRGHIVYLYKDKYYDITGEITTPRAKFIPTAYFGELIYDFKQCYTGGGATRAEVLKCVKHAEKDGNILTIKDTKVKPISTDGAIKEKTKAYREKFTTDPALIALFAHNYNLDPDKDLELMKEIHSIITVRHVYDAKRDTTESVVEYFNKIKDFVTSERYRDMDETGKRCFEHHVFEVLKGITIKGIGTEHFITGAIHYLSKPNVNEPLD